MQITINATQARKNFFNLLEQVANTDTTFIISKGKRKSPIIITRPKKVYEHEKPTDDLKIVMDIAGSLEGNSEYKANEDEIAKEIFIKDYLKKHD